MDEYIGRRKLIEEGWYLQKTVFQDGLTLIQKASLLDIPAADVRPVVMCKDCKWTKTDGMEDPAIYCEKWDRWEMPPDGFCWLGKKRKEVIDGN